MTNTHEAELQELLQQWHPPAGANGFEGMVAVAIAEVSGLPVRLARSGAQFGRDGLSNPGDFVIAFEAKRYSERPTLQEMTTKAALATDDLGGRVEVWACAMPTDLGDLAGRLRDILDKEGITLLVLDWPTGGLSPLAVLMAAARTRVNEWANSLGRVADAATLDRLLREVEALDGFAAALSRLKCELTDATAGLAALACRNSGWAHEVLADPVKARLTFGQMTIPARASGAVVPRKRSRQALAAAARPAGEGITVILGSEGSGKSWLVADWWLQQCDVPILLFAAGPLHSALDSDASGEEMIAALLSRQHGDLPTRWLRRIKRWRRWGDGRVRFALVLDGLNERASGKKWATIIDALVPVVRDLGGILIATCRPRYWKQNISGRLRATARQVKIGDFEEGELNTFFAGHGLKMCDIPADLHEFLANPRVAALAVKLLPRLLSVETLSRDQLLLEYWRSRIEERGDQVAHNDDEFCDLLAEHARQFRDTGTARFARSRLGQLSEQVVFGGRSYDDDLAELAEGRFFSPRMGGYEVTGAALPTALGMLLHKELIDEDLQDSSTASALIDAALDPVAGFDETANAVAACIALATSEKTLAPCVIIALIVAWFAVQNRDDDACRSIAASARAAPEAFLDAYERLEGGQDDRPFLELLYNIREDLNVWAVMSPRLAQWMGSWTPQAELYGRDEEAKARQVERSARIAAKCDTLLPDERGLLDRTTTCFDKESRLAKAAVQLSIGMPLAGLAEAIVGFAFVGALKGHGSDLHPLFCWMLRSNAIDFEATHAAVRAIIAPLCQEGASAAGKQAAAVAIEALGQREEAEEARTLWPRAPGQIWRSVDKLCDVDPLDPSAPLPSNLGNARNIGQSIAPAAVWTCYGTTVEDHNLSEIMAGLARFDIPSLVSLLRSIVLSAPKRREMALRQLAWHLPELSSLLEPSDLNAIRDVMDGLSKDGCGVAPNDRWWLLTSVVEALLPHLPFAERVVLVEGLPARVSLFNRLARHPAIIDATMIEQILVTVEHAGPQKISRRLHMLGAVVPAMTSRSRELIAGWLGHDNSTVAALAADVVRRAEDNELDQLALTTGVLEEPNAQEFLQANRSAALASVAVRQQRHDLVSHVALVDLGWVAGQLGGEAIAQYRRAIDAALKALLRPLATSAPNTLEIHLETDEEGRDRRLNFDVREVESDDPFAALKAATEDQDGQRWEEERQRAASELRRFVGGVTAEGAGALVQANWLHGLDEVVADDIEHARGWAERILSANDSGCDQTQAIGAALAAALASHDPDLATRLFRRALDANAIIDTLIGRAKIPLRLHALLRAPPHRALDTFRVELFIAARNDAEIEALVAAATTQDADVVLDGVVESLLASPIPARQALALTITGFRRPTTQTDSMLADDYGCGYLGDVATAARDAARRARWFEHWRDEALQAEDKVAYWRAAYLATRCIDRRGLIDRLEVREESPAWLHQGSWLEQLVKGAEKRTKKRADLLYGLKNPMR